MAHPQHAAARRGRSLASREALQGFVFVSPWILGFLLFTAGPMLFSLYASFTNYDITSQMAWIGFKNYDTMLNHDPLFWKSLRNTLYFVAISVPLQTVAGMLLAVILNRRMLGIRLFRTVFYLPSVLSGVGVYVLWMMLLSPSAGLVNLALSWLGIDGPAWLTDPAWTKNAIILMKLWGAGSMMLLYLASLQGVPNKLYEAAELDGAGRLRKFWHVTLPMITPVIFFEIVTGFIGGFQIFQEGYVMGYGNDPGAPMNSLLFYNLHMFLKAFKVFDMGYAMAMAWFLFLIVLLLTLINLTLSRFWVHYEGGEQ
ncbi:spermidine/putrescine ABC transporter permease [Paenibacillus yonginensis]|uniref:Spermidine/putrescine ABC transporter permease n=1 Tax=Paenibacillus yonginensis TaxID=1462996 RepID=A0A1B1MYJ9_9BACL|nr:sugar ABC transporter permease [Paenibacillus yonginensis]ANS74260.1 spermidine/putrescine ABC transporter permease [Paenibacillus yonginensis]